MAQSLETLRSSKVKSIFGRQLGIDKDDYLVGAPGLKRVVEDLTTGSTGTAMLAHGIARITASGSTQGPVQYNLPAPVVGVPKIILLESTSTGSFQFLSTPNGPGIRSASDGSSKSVVNLLGGGGGVVLWPASTSWWCVQHLYSSTGAPNVSYTTST